MQNEGRTIPIQIYLTEEEKQILDIKYRMSKSRSRGAYIRKMILEGYVYEVDFSELKRYNFLMSNIATNVNQIAHRINETRSIFQHDIDELMILANLGQRSYNSRTTFSNYSDSVPAFYGQEHCPRGTS